MPRLLHLGIGNFHRAHQAAYVQEAGDWNITGVSLRSCAVRDALAPLGFDYTLAIQGADGTSYRWITVLDDILFAPERPDVVLDAIATADLISLTITEKGYCLGERGALDLDHPDISVDLQGSNRSAIALLARGLERRSVPVAVLSCDNLASNGDTLASCVADFALAAGFRLPAHIYFPNTMVDRITPATTDRLRAAVKKATGIGDRAPVATEPFAEWIIEDFDAPRPDLEKAGVQIVANVAPYEARKLRLLNGAHSTLAYAGIRAGYRFVHEAIGDPDLHALIVAVMAEAAETLPQDIETTAYREALLDRFKNSSLQHPLHQIAMDGTQKLPIRLCDTIRDRQASGTKSPALWAGIDAWCDFVITETKAGRRLDDPKARVLAGMAQAVDGRRSLHRLINAPPPEASRS